MHNCIGWLLIVWINDNTEYNILHSINASKQGKQTRQTNLKHVMAVKKGKKNVEIMKQKVTHTAPHLCTGKGEKDIQGSKRWWLIQGSNRMMGLFPLQGCAKHLIPELGGDAVALVVVAIEVVLHVVSAHFAEPAAAVPNQMVGCIVEQIVANIAKQSATKEHKVSISGEREQKPQQAANGHNKHGTGNRGEHQAKAVTRHLMMNTVDDEVQSPEQPMIWQGLVSMEHPSVQGVLQKGPEQQTREEQSERH